MTLELLVNTQRYQVYTETSSSKSPDTDGNNGCDRLKNRNIVEGQVGERGWAFMSG